jgi:hypothetical protein
LQKAAQPGGFLTTHHGMRTVPIIRYVCLVGPFLLGMLFLLSDQDKSANIPERWTSVDALRAMAHLGEPVRGYAGSARFIRAEQASPEPAKRNQLAELAAQEKPLIMNAQARMDFAAMDSKRAAKQSTAAKPRKQKMAARQVRLRTAVAEDAQIRLDIFRPPSW